MKTWCSIAPRGRGILQYGCLKAISAGDDYLKTFVERCRQGRDIVCERLAGLPRPPEPAAKGILRLSRWTARTIAWPLPGVWSMWPMLVLRLEAPLAQAEKAFYGSALPPRMRHYAPG